MITDGLYILCSPGGYYPYVRVGWCRRIDGFIEVYNCRLIRRFGTNAELSRIAKTGPMTSTQLLSPSPVEYVSVVAVSRLIPADPAAWVKECPRPETFVEEVA